MSDLEEKEYRVKYFPPNDLACGLHIEKVEHLFQNKDQLEIVDINDAIEFYNIYLYFQDKSLKWKKWNDEQIDLFRQFSITLKQKTFSFFNTISEFNIHNELKKLNFEYHDDFVSLFEKSGLYKKIPKKIIRDILLDKQQYLYIILQNQKLTDYLGIEIIDILLSSEVGGEYLIKAADSEDNPIDTKYYVPKCLTQNQRNKILENYLNSKQPNLNYINLLLDMPLAKKIPPTLIKQYVNKKKVLEDELFKNSKTQSNLKVCFEPNQTELVDFKIGPGLSMCTTYSLDWILENLDYPSLLNNFIYMFEFSDETMRINLPSSKSGSSLLDHIFQNNNSKIYSMNPTSTFMESNYNISMHMYYQILKSHNVDLEKIITWFFSEYIVQEFQGPIFKTHITSEPRSYLEKCQELVANIEVICKQFTCFKELGEISYELLAINSKPIKYEDIKSLLSNKYAYGIGEDFESLCFALFSNQCMLHFVQRLNKSYESFYSLISKETISTSDYPEYLQNVIKKLEEWDLIEITDEKIIRKKNIIRIQLLYDLYTVGFINTNRYSKEYRNELNYFESRKIVYFGDTLFAKPEAAFINYYLNDTYSNGPKIRNLYAHGIEYLNEDNNKHYNNFLILLRIMIFLIIKINDEFCLIHPIPIFVQ